jgi:hypothetical protein
VRKKVSSKNRAWKNHFRVRKVFFWVNIKEKIKIKTQEKKHSFKTFNDTHLKWLALRRLTWCCWMGGVDEQSLWSLLEKLRI